LTQTRCALDASDTGTGKTYVAVALAKSLGLEPFIICPKSVIPSWINVAKSLEVSLFGIANYEMIKGCKYYTSNLERVECPYVDKFTVKDQKDDDDDDSYLNKPKKKPIEDYKFGFPKNVIVIFDEAHRCKNSKSITSRMMISIFKSQCKILLLSATISDKIDTFKPFGVVFGFYKEMKEFKMWVRKLKDIKEYNYRGKNMTDDQITLDIIHSKIFPHDGTCQGFGSRMRIKDLGDMFPSNQVLSQAYMSNNKEDIQEQYMIIKQAFEEMKHKETRSSGLGKIIRARMKIEMLKVPIMLDIVEEAFDSNYSVAIFVNFKETLNYLAHYFETDCVIHGEQKMDERQDCIDKFQSNKSKIIIAIIQAGGVGISLHDIHGEHPRMSVISPTWSGQDMQQVLGRIHRAGSKTPALQRIVYVAETYEEQICELIGKKLTNISGINDGDLMGPQFTKETYEEVNDNKDDNKDNKDVKEIKEDKSLTEINIIPEEKEKTNTKKSKKVVKIPKINNDNNIANDERKDKDDSKTKRFKNIVDKDKKKKYIKKENKT